MRYPSIWQTLQRCDLVLVESCRETRAVLDISGSYSKALEGEYGLCIGIEIQFETFSQASLNRASLLLAASDETLDQAILPEADRWFLWQRYQEDLSTDELNQRLEAHHLLAKYISSGLCKSTLQNREDMLELVNLV
ncbi:hypothetical protein M9194_20610 [Vibrio sp. S4M6]|uniref:hypothetical protein n=1 Tax=Vibrio sinus TaxID=2946865 RepID=UPI00202AA024|nr:hypothetical protein [Vibrio sinus]MCL9783832.1 hypothetical protein [Vibrio sinus]